jgi:hypothetical protein
MEPHPFRRTARLAGALYLVVFLGAPLAYLLARSTVVVDHDAATTARNLLDYEARVWAGFAVGVAVLLVEVVLARLLYALFRQVNRRVSLAAASARLAAAVVQAAALAAVLAALTLVGDAGAVTGAALSVLDASDAAVPVWGVVFALHLLLLSYLVFKSELFPDALAILPAAASLGYLAGSLAAILAPGSSDLLALAAIVLAAPAELAFALWLALKGVRGEASEPAPVTHRAQEVPT